MSPLWEFEHRLVSIPPQPHVGWICAQYQGFKGLFSACTVDTMGSYLADIHFFLPMKSFSATSQTQDGGLFSDPGGTKLAQKDWVLRYSQTILRLSMGTTRSATPTI